MKKRALLIVDPQIDFITGTLPVAGAEEAMDLLANYIRESGDEYVHIIVTADSHPLDHCSFRESGGEWPRHCVRDSVGAAVWPAVMNALCDIGGRVSILHKGTERDREEYSIFQNESAAGSILYFIANEGIDVIDVCGLAGDICVASTVRDCLRLLDDISLNLLTRFTPSLDGGVTLSSLISNYHISCDR